MDYSVKRGFSAKYKIFKNGRFKNGATLHTLDKSGKKIKWFTFDDPKKLLTHYLEFMDRNDRLRPANFVTALVAYLPGDFTHVDPVKTEENNITNMDDTNYNIECWCVSCLEYLYSHSLWPDCFSRLYDKAPLSRKPLTSMLQLTLLFWLGRQLSVDQIEDLDTGSTGEIPMPINVRYMKNSDVVKLREMFRKILFKPVSTHDL